MEKLFKKKESLVKLTVFICLLLTPITTLSAKIEAKQWNKHCENNTQKCVTIIRNEIAIEGSDKKQVIATAYVRLGSTTKKSMDLVDGKEKTYKLKEENQLIPILFFNLPLNINLRKKPLILVDNKSILNLSFSHCNAQVGCVTNSQVNDKIIEQFKVGKELSIAVAIYGSNETKQIKFPLKGFTKTYRSLFK